MDAQPILKKTLVTVAVMVGAWVAFVGTVSLVAVLVTSHIVGSTGESASPNDANETVTPRRLPGSGPAHLSNPGRDLHEGTPAHTTANRPAHETI
jgi:hypothetical protein